MNRTRSLGLIVVFAALTAVLDLLPGLPRFLGLESAVWYGWVFLAAPLAGIALNPYEAFLSVLIGVMASHTVALFDPFEYFFTIGAPIGAMVSSLVERGRLRSVFPYYAVLLGVYFVTPAAWSLPLWALWDTYLAFIVLVAAILLGKRLHDLVMTRYRHAVSTLIGLEADVLFRIFLFVPLGTYSWLYGFPLDFVRGVWVASAFITPIQVGVALLSTTLAGRIILNALRVTRISPEHDRA